MADLISRQAATTVPVLPKEHRHYQTSNLDDAYEQGWNDLQECIENLPSAQPEKRTEERAETHACDLIDRQAAIACACSGLVREMDGENWRRVADIREDLRNMPPVPQTLYGYNIDHLKLIAEVLRKENLSPERVVEAITDIGRIASIIRAECEEELKKSVERCMI